MQGETWPMLRHLASSLVHLADHLERGQKPSKARERNPRTAKVGQYDILT